MTLSATATVLMTVAMTVAMAKSVLVEQHEAHNIDDEPRDADVQHPVCVFYPVLIVCQSLDRFDDDSEAKRNEKY